MSLDEQSLRQAGWDPGLPTKVIVHGFTNTIASRAIQDIKNGRRHLAAGSIAASEPFRAASVRRLCSSSS